MWIHETFFVSKQFVNQTLARHAHRVNLCLSCSEIHEHGHVSKCRNFGACKRLFPCWKSEKFSVQTVKGLSSHLQIDFWNSFLLRRLEGQWYVQLPTMLLGQGISCRHFGMYDDQSIKGTELMAYVLHPSFVTLKKEVQQRLLACHEFYLKGSSQNFHKFPRNLKLFPEVRIELKPRRLESRWCWEITIWFADSILQKNVTSDIVFTKKYFSHVKLLVF